MIRFKITMAATGVVHHCTARHIFQQHGGIIFYDGEEAPTIADENIVAVLTAPAYIEVVTGERQGGLADG